MAPLLEVADMPASIAFYRDALGFEVVSTSEPGDRFEDAEPAPAPDPDPVGGRGITLYFGCPDVDAAYTHLRAKGLDVRKPTIRDYGMKQLYVTDPDGFGLCFQWPA